MAVTAENGEYAGNINGFMGDVELQDIEVNENDFKFGMEMNGPAGAMVIVFSGVVDGDNITGT